MTTKLSLAGPNIRFPRASADRIRHALVHMLNGAFVDPNTDDINYVNILTIASKHDFEEWQLLLDCLDEQLLD